MNYCAHNSTVITQPLPVVTHGFAPLGPIITVRRLRHRLCILGYTVEYVPFSISSNNSFLPSCKTFHVKSTFSLRGLDLLILWKMFREAQSGSWKVESSLQLEVVWKHWKTADRLVLISHVVGFHSLTLLDPRRPCFPNRSSVSPPNMEVSDYPIEVQQPLRRVGRRRGTTPNDCAGSVSVRDGGQKEAVGWQ